MGTTVGTYPVIKGLASKKFRKLSTKQKKLIRDAYKLNAPLNHTQQLSELLDRHKNSEKFCNHSFSEYPKFCETLKPSSNHEQSQEYSLLNSITKHIIKSYSSELGIDFNWIESNIYTNSFTSNETKLSADWHMDRRPINWYRIFVLLHDTDPSHGPLHYLSRENSKCLIKSGFKRGDIVDEFKHPVRKFVGGISDSVLINAELCLHRAGIPNPGKYRSILEIVISI